MRLKYIKHCKIKKLNINTAYLKVLYSPYKFSFNMDKICKFASIQVSITSHTAQMIAVTLQEHDYIECNCKAPAMLLQLSVLYSSRQRNTLQ